MAVLNTIKLKVCGMRDPDNIQEVLSLSPDYMGFIFYPKSPRYVGADFPVNFLRGFPITTQKIGVFVDEYIDTVKALAERYALDLLQLHGSESVAYCEELKKEGYQVIKVFSGNDKLTNTILEEYVPVVDYFLTDTPSAAHGGTGQAFDWTLLQNLTFGKPLFLSGGLSLKNIHEVEALEGINLHAIDVNSKFEIEPGLKDVKLLKKLKTII